MISLFVERIKMFFVIMCLISETVELKGDNDKPFTFIDKQVGQDFNYGCALHTDKSNEDISFERENTLLYNVRRSLKNSTVLNMKLYKFDNGTQIHCHGQRKDIIFRDSSQKTSFKIWKYDKEKTENYQCEAPKPLTDYSLHFFKINTYAPVSSACAQELEKFWESVRDVLDLAEGNERVIMCGDLNVCVGIKRYSYEAVLGPYGDKRVNEAENNTIENVKSQFYKSELASRDNLNYPLKLTEADSKSFLVCFYIYCQESDNHLKCAREIVEDKSYQFIYTNSLYNEDGDPAGPPYILIAIIGSAIGITGVVVFVLIYIYFRRRPQQAQENLNDVRYAELDLRNQSKTPHKVEEVLYSEIVGILTRRENK